MSAHFSKGDRVEWRGCGDTGRKGTLATPADNDDPYSQVTVAWDNGSRGTVRIGALRKVEPEDKADLYVEPEPLKEGAEPAFNDDDVHHLKVIAGSTVIFDGLAVFEEADNGNVNVTPVPRCTSLFIRPGSDSSLGIVRCGQHQGHGHGHWTIGEHPATSWNDKQEYGRVTEGGAS